MKLDKLFQMQKVLKDRINYNETDRFEKLVLALLVEVGECANEWRGFKFWSKDQEPRKTKRIKCPTCKGNGMVAIGDGVRGLKICSDCDNPRGGMKTTNPLLEEYVDGLHFVLELGLHFGFQKNKPFLVHADFEVEKMFLKLYKITMQFVVVSGRQHKEFYFGELLSNYLGLGKILGFTWEQIEQAYMDKNAVNHQRQEDGY